MILLIKFDTTPEGHTYADRYNVTSYPHVGIIDPRTGRLVLRREGWTQMNPMTAAAFSELATDFCSRHSFDNPPLAPQLHGTAFGSHPSTSRPGKRPVNEMTEEEQLEAALQASRNEMEEDDLPVQTTDTGDNDQSQVAVPADNMENIKDNSTDSNLKSAESSWEQEIAGMDVGDEPTVNDGVARIMFRMPDGKKLVRKFYLTDPVKKVYGYVAVRYLSALFCLSMICIIHIFTRFQSNPTMMLPKGNRSNSRLDILPRICFHLLIIQLRMLVFQVKQFMFVGGLYNVAFYSELKNTPCTSARNLDALSFFAVISKCPMIGQ